ncbi:class A beta-lactamase-related serine hydrolase [Chryseobacterium joostei]|uniref:Class A beta-lactamase-related serine hydrolase n=1 Tax=Chryseobacterium joostei TaxID=112234 RepID=A0A1N7IRI2_9FLAO|nr:serine hydrolase domain-containing protein [Chryseobacterium joostei]AZA98291.1 class A beta-lactamase-related serine hydrolase [Chryseobacterium joostei]SIS39704.1 CubicO group peptidase, beta-lactamase class C family [Chryseobacterium joostei]
MKLSVLGISLLLLTSSCTINNTNNSQSSSSLSTIDSIAINNHFNGVILVAKDSTIQYEKAFGYSDIDNKTKLKTKDQFYIGSISKQITAVLILREYEKGNLQLTDKLDKYFPEIKQPWAKQVTIHHLLTHTHGILEIDKPLEFEVGTQFHYSQIGFGLLGQILEKISHKSFEKIATELFTQYGLKNTFHPDNKKYNNLVKGYEEDENGKLIYATGNPVKYIAGGGFISNAEDVLKWYRLLYSGKLVKTTTLDMMKTRYATRNHPVFDKIEYGYGLLFLDGEQNTQIGAFGYAPGFPSAAYYYPKTHINLIVLENIGYNLDDFKKTFKTHTDLMKFIKKEK